jgi:hypothetical protein
VKEKQYTASPERRAFDEYCGMLVSLLPPDRRYPMSFTADGSCSRRGCEGLSAGIPEPFRDSPRALCPRCVLATGAVGSLREELASRDPMDPREAMKSLVALQRRMAGAARTIQHAGRPMPAVAPAARRDQLPPHVEMLPAERSRGTPAPSPRRGRDHIYQRGHADAGSRFRRREEEDPCSN